MASKFHDVGENENIKEFHAHSNVLRARSPYFKSAFSNKWIAKTNNNMIEFEKPNINPTVFEMILKYIYTGEIDLTKQIGTDILGLLVASDELLLDCKKLQDHCLESICVDPQQFITSKDFPSIDKDILYRFLERDDLQIEEIKTLNQFIPLIRFSEINSADFFDKVRPYKQIIPQYIYEEIMEFYMKNTLPKTTPRIRNHYIDSKIIKSKFINIISN
ncbi:BTB-domain-containing protein [Rhizophagus irregularis]|uniref:BTB-domain-containing protein n=1 Tax=Rhizophagus irregularis TaxID=588596 RepID=A0A2I1FSX6_9GLOM|nr:BTB-domain-containing protein [Rhizophagus irregularis]